MEDILVEACVGLHLHPEDVLALTEQPLESLVLAEAVRLLQQHVLIFILRAGQPIESVVQSALNLLRRYRRRLLDRLPDVDHLWIAAVDMDAHTRLNLAAFSLDPEFAPQPALVEVAGGVSKEGLINPRTPKDVSDGHHSTLDAPLSGNHYFRLQKSLLQEGSGGLLFDARSGLHDGQVQDARILDFEIEVPDFLQVGRHRH